MALACIDTYFMYAYGFSWFQIDATFAQTLASQPIPLPGPALGRQWGLVPPHTSANCRAPAVAKAWPARRGLHLSTPAAGHRVRPAP